MIETPINSLTDQPTQKNVEQLLYGVYYNDAPMPSNAPEQTSNPYYDNSIPNVQEYREDLDIGKTYPLIRINDHYFSADEIKYFEVSCFGFLPTMTLKVETVAKDLVKENIIKEGDRCSVFFSMDHKHIAPLRADFLIKSCYTNTIRANGINTRGYKFYIKGELYIPLFHSNLNYTFTGTSKDALRDVAKKLGLGFCFSDEMNTNDTQIWQCAPFEENGIEDFIKEVTSHAWSDMNAFYDSWIDPRYALTFVNVNTILTHY